MTKPIDPNNPAISPSGAVLPQPAPVSTVTKATPVACLDPYEKERIEQDLGRPREVDESAIGLPFQARVEVDMSAALRARREIGYLLQPPPKP